MADSNKKFWQGTNFWVSAAMVVLGFWMGFSEQLAEQAVGAVFGVVAAFISVRNFLKDAQFDWRGWVSDTNFWNYLAVVIVSIVPTIPAGLLPALEDVVTNLISGNWQAAIIGAITLINIVYKIFKLTIINALQEAEPA